MKCIKAAPVERDHANTARCRSFAGFSPTVSAPVISPAINSQSSLITHGVEETMLGDGSTAYAFDPNFPT